MNRSIKTIFLLALAATLAPAASGAEPERQMNVRQGPETVFAESPAEIFSALAAASATGQNGRVGNELVFWGYRLADGSEAYLVACAMIDAVDCSAREAQVCPGGSEVLARGTSPGLVRELNCRAIATPGPGDLRPGCRDQEEIQELAVSLLSCS